ncbi:MAG: LLM class flavin-dependent oxidoreductase, partial [Alphaproteobacteria bacterium]|nr:LLM class flavin-dependent oxidoreductase [Alphaproteobacteria bacterium]
AQAHPNPVQKPHPVLINAGHSPAGSDLAAREVDFAFIGFDSVEAAREVARRVRGRAHSE